MPVAIATSKRKFHDLLERITSSPAEPAPASKRARIAPNADTVNGAERPLAVPRSRKVSSNGLGRKVTTSVAAKSFSPWSHESFLQRLATFSELRHWSSKPDAVNEVAWARRGWTCDATSVNRVACRGGCEQRVLVQLRPRQKDANDKEIDGTEDYNVDIDDELVKRYEELIVSSHSEDCLWKQHGCSDDIYRMPIARPSVWIPELRTRYASFTQMLREGGRLPSTRRLLHPLKLDAVKSQLPQSLAQEDKQTDESNQAEAEPQSETNNKWQDNALMFALLGWQHAFRDGMHLATCAHCFRRLGLWLYVAESDEDADAADDSLMKLDLVENHRDYCPWVNGDSQRQPGSLAGLPAWQVLQRCIENHASFEASGRQLHGPSDSTTDQTPAPIVLAEVEKTPEQIEKEDKRRAQRLLDFTRSMGKRMGLVRRRP